MFIEYNMADLTFQVEVAEIESLFVSPFLAHVHAQRLEQRNKLLGSTIYKVFLSLLGLMLFLSLVCLASGSLFALLMLCRLEIAELLLAAISAAEITA